MRLALGAAVALGWAWSAGSAAAGDHDKPEGTRFVERTPYPKHPYPDPDTMRRAGYPQEIARWAIPGLTKFQTAGYIGGATVCNNHALTKGVGAATGPLTTGTFGWDFAGFGMRPGRVFLAATPTGANRSNIARNYLSEGPHVPDVFALRPFRKAVLEKQEAKHPEVEEHGSHGEHGNGHDEKGHNGNGHGAGQPATPGEKPKGGH
jgi:hypothetical protein